jgi:outer membrane protein TolC
VLLAPLAILACSAPRPAGEAAERQRSEDAGRAFEVGHAQRKLPDLPARPTLRQVLHYAFRSNADLERAWFEWRMALERIPQAVSLDDPRLSFAFMFSEEEMTRWDRSTVGVSQMVPFPGKLELAGRIALEDARAAGHRFEGAKFSLQAAVASAWQELLLVDRNVEIDARNVELLRDFAEIVGSRVASGGAMQADLIKAELEFEIAQNDLLSRRAERAPVLAMLNTLLSRPAGAEIGPRPAEGPALALPDDATILALAAERNPDLQAVAAQVRGRADALDLAHKAWLPDFDLGALLRGDIERALMAAINVPLRFDRIQGAIDEARAAVRAMQAELRARGDDVRARLVLQLFLARNGDRQSELLGSTLIPRARDVVNSIRAGYGTGSTSFLELIDAQRSLLGLERMQAEVDAIRATAVASLEALCAFDFGVFGPPENGGS